MIIHALQTGAPSVEEIFRIGYCIRGIVIRQIFLIQMKYCLQSMYHHMVGRAGPGLVISPFYFILLSPSE